MCICFSFLREFLSSYYPSFCLPFRTSRAENRPLCALIYKCSYKFSDKYTIYTITRIKSNYNRQYVNFCKAECFFIAKKPIFRPKINFCTEDKAPAVQKRSYLQFFSFDAVFLVWFLALFSALLLFTTFTEVAPVCVFVFCFLSFTVAHSFPCVVFAEAKAYIHAPPS